MHQNIAKDIIDSYVNSESAGLYRGVVIAAYPEKMTVDAFIYSTGTYLYDVPVGAVATGEKQRVATMLEVDTPIIIAYTSEKTKPIVLCSYTNSDFEQKSKAEKILEGESLVSSKSGASNKIALDGSNYRISGTATSLIADGDGVIYNNSMSGQVKDFGFNMQKGVDLTTLLGPTCEYTFYEDIEQKNKIYTPEQIDEEAEEEIIDAAADILLKIDGDKDNLSFSDEVGKLEDAYMRHSLDSSAETITEVENFLNSFILKNSGSSINLKLGKTDRDGIIFSLKVLDSSGTPKGEITIDKDANMVIDMASCRIVR